MEIIIVIFSVLLTAFVSFLYGKSVEKNKNTEEEINTGEKIEKIIRDNNSISKSDWVSWLRSKNNKN